MFWRWGWSFELHLPSKTVLAERRYYVVFSCVTLPTLGLPLHGMGILYLWMQVDTESHGKSIYFYMMSRFVSIGSREVCIRENDGRWSRGRSVWLLVVSEEQRSRGLRYHRRHIVALWIKKFDVRKGTATERYLYFDQREGGVPTTCKPSQHSMLLPLTWSRESCGTCTEWCEPQQ